MTESDALDPRSEHAGVAAVERSLPEIVSDGQLETLFQSVPDGITIQDPSGRMLYANDAAALVAGFTSAREMIGATLAQIMQHFEALDASGRPLAFEQLPASRALAGEGNAEAEISVRDLLHGSKRWIMLRSTPIWGEQGEVRYAVTIFHDISERRQAEEEQRFLAEAGEMLASSLDYETTLASIARLAAPRLADWCAVDVLQDDGTLRHLAIAHQDRTMVEWAEDLQRRFPADLNPEHGIGAVLHHGRSVFLPDIDEHTLETSTSDSEQRAILRQLNLHSAIIVPLMIRGKAIGAITLLAAGSGRRFVARDLRLAEELARRAALAVDNARLYRQAQSVMAEREAERDRLQQVINVLPEAIAIADARGQISVSNAAARQIWGETLIAIDLSEAETGRVFHLDGSPYASNDLPLIRSILLGDVVLAEQLVIRNAITGERTPVLVNSAPLREAHGAIIGAVSVFQDISAIKDLEQQKDAFLAAISHDLKSPLTSIKGTAQILQRRVARSSGPDAERLLEGLRTIDATTTRIAAMLNELLDITRLEMGRPLDLDRQPVDLVLLARQAVDEQQQTTERHRIAIESSVESLVAPSDPERIARVLGNLLANAIKYSPDGGTVTVLLDLEEAGEGSMAVLRVHDDGMGIPAADLPHVFDRFYRGSNVAGRIGGSGIGLAGVRQIIESHGGSISVQSEEGQGSTFIVRLPLDAV